MFTNLILLEDISLLFNTFIHLAEQLMIAYTVVRNEHNHCIELDFITELNLVSRFISGLITNTSTFCAKVKMLYDILTYYK